MRGVDARSSDIVIAMAAFAANPLCLPGSQNRELDSVLGQDFQGLGVDGSFWQPHAFGLATEAAFEVLDPPPYLRHFVATIGQGQDHMVVALGDRAAMTGITAAALLVRFENGCVNAPARVLHPGKQRWAEIKTDVRIIVDQLDDPILRVQDSRSGIGRITFGGDAFVPVVIGIGRVLQLHSFQVRILAGWLVEVTVNADVFHWTSDGERFCSSSRKEKGASLSRSIAVGSSLSGPFQHAEAEYSRTVQLPSRSARSRSAPESAKLKTTA